jgi:RecA-family ATPase
MSGNGAATVSRLNADDGEAYLPSALLPASRLLDSEFPPVTFAIEPYFPRVEITELVGAHGIFKSTAALAACLSVAAGRSWGGVPTSRGRAVFITMEDNERTIAWRVRAWLEGIPAGKERSDAEADVRQHFAYLSREWSQDLILTSTDRNTTIVRQAVVDHVRKLVEGAAIVTLETASRLHDGPEMNEALAVFARAAEGIAVASGAAVCIVRHVSKAAAREQVVDSYAGRGGGALSDAARSVLVMTRDRKPEEDEEGEPDPCAPVRLTHAKSTHAPKGPRIVWKPTACEHGVYLAPLSQAEETHDAAKRLLAYLADAGEITRTALHKETPAGLSREIAKRAMTELVEAGKVTASAEKRGRQFAEVYRVADGWRPSV